MLRQSKRFNVVSGAHVASADRSVAGYDEFCKSQPVSDASDGGITTQHSQWSQPCRRRPGPPVRTPPTSPGRDQKRRRPPGGTQCRRHFAGRAQTSAGRGRVTTHKRVRVGDTVAGRTYRCMASRELKTLTGRMACSCQSSTKTKTMGAGYAGLMAFDCVWSRSSDVAGPGRHCRASPCTKFTAGARPAKVMPARQNGGRAQAPQ
jgi:hypothetical protein